MPTQDAPLVSVAVPLCRSKRFVSNIRRNLEAIDYPNLEIIVSDRHCADDAVVLLQEDFRGDRFRFIQRRDGINWVEHCNSLLRIASGTYFLWMLHDDVYPSDYISRLVSSLEERRDAILAFGRMVAIDLDGRPLPHIRFTSPPIPNKGPWTFGASVRLLYWGAGIPFRGVFRRDVVTRSGLYLPSTYGTAAADQLWVFALSLKGRICFVPECSCQKRCYRGSTSDGFAFGIRYALSCFVVSRAYLHDLCSSRRDVLLGTLAVFVWSLVDSINKSIRSRLPDSFKRLVRRGLSRMAT